MIALYCRHLQDETIMLAKVVIVVIFVGILTSLGAGLLFMMRDKSQSDRAVRSLTVRIGISVGLFVLLFVLWYLGLISPHGVRP